MADLMEKAAAFIDRMRKANASKTVVYNRGASSVSVSATIGRTLFTVDDGRGMAIEYESRDYLITAADLIISSAVTLPQRGDMIEETVGSQTMRYEVLGPGNEPAWRYSDPYRKTLRIHTKHIAPVSEEAV